MLTPHLLQHHLCNYFLKPASQAVSQPVRQLASSGVSEFVGGLVDRLAGWLVG